VDLSQSDSEVLSAVPLSEGEVAARYQVPAPTVKTWRRKRTGPRYFYAGRHVRYRLADLIAWEKSESERQAS
jgi:hypothetical protein